MNDRRALSTAFLASHGWDDADRRFLAGDASDRSYDRLRRPSGDSAVLMDAPPGKGDDPRDFIRIATHLRQIGLSAPAILATDLDHGFLLIEDLGDDLFARLLDHQPDREVALYTAATDVLLRLQSQPAPSGLPDLSARDWAEAAAFALDFYAAAAGPVAPGKRARFVDTLAAALSAHADGPRVLILRDYHAENLLLLSGRQGAAAVGILDFQLAQMGQPGYDLVSLVQDARRDVSATAAAAAVARFARQTGTTPEALALPLAVLGAQRALRIIGVFARLCLVAGKPGYLALLPRVWGHLRECLAHPALADLRHLCDALLPPPDDDLLHRIRNRCATISP